MAMDILRSHYMGIRPGHYATGYPGNVHTRPAQKESKTVRIINRSRNTPH